MDLTTTNLQDIENTCLDQLTKAGSDITNARKTAIRQLARSAGRLRSELVMDELDQKLGASKPRPTLTSGEPA